MLRLFTKKQKNSKKHNGLELGEEGDEAATMETSQTTDKRGLSGSVASNSLPSHPNTHNNNNRGNYHETGTTSYGFARSSSYSSISGNSMDNYVSRDAALSAEHDAHGEAKQVINQSSAGNKDTSGPTTTTAAERTSGPRNDARDETLSVVRYVYDTTKQAWGHQLTRLCIRHPNRGIHQDDFHVYFACDLLLMRDCPVHLPHDVQPQGEGQAVHSKVTIDTQARLPPSAAEKPVDGGDTQSAERTAMSKNDAAKEEDGGVLKRIPVTARMFRHNITDVKDADYFGEGQCQALAESLAYKFGRFPVAPGTHRRPLPLLTNRNVCRIDTRSLPDHLCKQSKGFFSYVTTDSHDILLLLEPDVRECAAVGVSFSLQTVPGAVEEDVYPPFDPQQFSKTDLKQVAEAFSHFAYDQHNGQLLVHGLLSAHRYLLDPLVYTTDGQGFGMNNGGAKAIHYWVSGHRCNALCKAYRLDPVNQLPAEVAAPVAAPPTAKELADAKKAQKELEKREKKRLEKEAKEAKKSASKGSA